MRIYLIIKKLNNQFTVSRNEMSRLLFILALAMLPNKNHNIMQENAKKVYDLLNKEFPKNDVTMLESGVVTLKLNSYVGYLDFAFFNKMKNLCGYEAKRSDMGILFLFTCINSQKQTPEPRIDEE